MNRYPGKRDEILKLKSEQQLDSMGTAASSVEKQSTKSLSREELKDPKSVMLASARNGNIEELTLVLQQGMDPNERESPFSG